MWGFGSVPHPEEEVCITFCNVSTSGAPNTDFIFKVLLALAAAGNSWVLLVVPGVQLKNHLKTPGPQQGALVSLRSLEERSQPDKEKATAIGISLSGVNGLGENSLEPFLCSLNF